MTNFFGGSNSDEVEESSAGDVNETATNGNTTEPFNSTLAADDAANATAIPETKSEVVSNNILSDKSAHPFGEKAKKKTKVEALFMTIEYLDITPMTPEEKKDVIQL